MTAHRVFLYRWYITVEPSASFNAEAVLSFENEVETKLKALAMRLEIACKELGPDAVPHIMALALAGLMCCLAAEKAGAERVVGSVESWTNQLCGTLGEIRNAE